jgi:hypothetical protein
MAYTNKAGGWGAGLVVLIIVGAIARSCSNAPTNPVAALPPAPPPGQVARLNPRDHLQPHWHAEPIIPQKRQGDQNVPFLHQAETNPNNLWENSLVRDNPPGDRSQQPQKSPLEKLGWSRARCMLCQKQRTNQEGIQFSDADGFGFCANCGICANAFRLHSLNFQQGFGSNPQVDAMAKEYITAIGDRYPLYLAAFAHWGNAAQWSEAWRNYAVLTAGPNSGR